MEMELRPYQTKAMLAVLGQWGEGHKRTLLSLPTGTGKTCVFASVIGKNYEKTHGKTLVIAHRAELLTQAADKIKKICGFDCAVEKADSHAYGSQLPVTVGSVQTLCSDKRLEQYPADYFDMIVIDEAHHSTSPSYQKVLQHFSPAKVLGVTATIDRGDKQELSSCYDSLAYTYSLPEAIKDGYLCPIKAQMIPLKLDISKVKVSQGDYELGDIGESLEPYLPLIADEIVKYASNRKIVVFLPLIATSQKFTECLKERGIKAAEVNGESPDRDEILKDFQEGKYQVLCNSMLLTEGWDCPSVDCIVVLRPTKIRSLYVQMVGRGTRLSPETDKKDLLLLDFLWMTGKHDLCRPSTMFAPSKKIADKIDEVIAADNEIHDLTDTEKKAEKDIVKETEANLAKELAEKCYKQAKLVDPIQYAISLSDEDLIDYEPVFMWEKEPATERQLDYLLKMGISPDKIPNKGYACELLKRITRRKKSGLSSPKQIRCLEKQGFNHVETWTSELAGKFIDYLMNNNWQLPNDFDASSYVPKEVVNA